FSASQFQLPHYLNALFPMMSIGVAQLLVHMDHLPITQTLHRMQWCLAILLILLLCVLTFLFHSNGWLMLSLGFVLVGGIALFYTQRPSGFNVLGISYTAGLLIGIFYGAYLFPGMLPYQGGNPMGHYINTQFTEDPPTNRIYVLHYEDASFTLGFRSNVPLQVIKSAEQWDTLPDGSLLAVSDQRRGEMPPDFKATE